jgi:hypothetical protein
MIHVSLTTDFFEGVEQTVGNFLSYFTVQSNIFVAVMSIFLLVKKPKRSKLLDRLEFISLVNITVTGLVYGIVLASLWEPTGLAFIADILLHYITPGLYFFYWFFFYNKEHFDYSIIPTALIYPAIFLIYTLIRGPIVDFYPYPFIDLNEISIGQLIVNSVLVGIFFLFVASVIVIVNNLMSSKKLRL